MTNDRLPEPQPAAEPPLGIQRPLLPSMPLGHGPLGQSLLQPKFLTPLGARPLSILDPSVFLGGQDADLSAWESPFQDSPFFDPPSPRSPDPTPAVQTQLQPRPPESNPESNRSIDPEVDALNAPQFESVAERSPVEPIDPEISESSIAPPFAPEPVAEQTAAPSSVQRSGENLPEVPNAAPIAQPASQPEPEPNLELIEAPISPAFADPTATVQRSPTASSLQDSPIPATTQPVPPEAAISIVEQQSEPTLAADATEPPGPPSSALVESTIAPVPELEASPNSPPAIAPQAAIQRAETPEVPAAPTSRPEVLTSPIGFEPINEADAAAPVQALESATLPPPEPPSAPVAAIESLVAPLSSAPEPAIAPLTDAAIEPPSTAASVVQAAPEQNSPPEAPASISLPEERAAEPFGSEQGSAGDDQLPYPTIPSAESLMPPSPAPAQPSDSLSSFNLESTFSETVQRSSLEPAGVDFELEQSDEIEGEGIANVPTIEPPQSVETIHRKTVETTVADSIPATPELETTDSPTDDRPQTFEAIQRENVDIIPDSILEATVSPTDQSSPVAEAEKLDTAIANASVTEQLQAIEAVQRKVENTTTSEEMIEQPQAQTITKSQTQTAAIAPIERLATDSSQVQNFPEIAPIEVQTKQIEPENLSSPSPSDSAESIDRSLTSLVSIEDFSQQTVQSKLETQPAKAEALVQHQPELEDQEEVVEPAVQQAVQQEVAGITEVIDLAKQEQSEAQEQSIAFKPAASTEQPADAVPSSIRSESEIASEEVDAGSQEVEASISTSKDDKTETAQPSAIQLTPDNFAEPIQRKPAEAEIAPTDSLAATSEAQSEVTIAQDSASIESLGIESRTETPGTESKLEEIEDSVPTPVSAIEPSIQRATIAEEPAAAPGAIRNDGLLETEPILLPELPTVIQRLSILEPIAQRKPLIPPNELAPTQISIPSQSTSIPEQFQPLDRLFDPPSEVPDAIQKSDAKIANSTPAEAPVTAEWSNIAELFEVSEPRLQRSPEASDISSRFNGEFNGELEFDSKLELDSELNNYSDLNLSSTNAASREMIQAKEERVGDPPNLQTFTDPPESQATSQAEASPEQLERLAQEIYQLVRQRLALERERFGRSGSGRSF